MTAVTKITTTTTVLTKHEITSQIADAEVTATWTEDKCNDSLSMSSLKLKLYVTCEDQVELSLNVDDAEALIEMLKPYVKAVYEVMAK